MNPSLVFPFLIGAPRSGTTLLRFMLDAHPQLSIPPETGFVQAVANWSGPPLTPSGFMEIVTNYPPGVPNWPDFQVAAEELRERVEALRPFDPAAAVRWFYRLYASARGKCRFGDKTPLYCLHMESIQRLLPEARFVHIIRDGRDAALSLRPLWFAPAQDIPSLARHWSTHVLAARSAASRVRAYTEVRYEDLVRNPRPELERLCRFLDLDFNERMLEYWRYTPERLTEHGPRLRSDGRVLVSKAQRLSQQRNTTAPLLPHRAFRWRHEMHPGEQRQFLETAGDLLESLGYLLPE